MKKLFNITSVLVCLVTGILLWYWFTIELPMHPPEPIAQGNFPSQPIWVFEADEQIASTPIVQGSYAYIRTLSSVYALDVKSRKVIWRTGLLPCDFYSLCTPMKIYQDYLVVPIDNAGVEVLSRQTGKSIWQVFPHDKTGKLVAGASNSSLTFEGNMLFVARSNWNLTAYSLKDGEIEWEQSIPGRTSPEIVVVNGVVYLSAWNFVQAYDAEYGTKLWRKDFSTNIRALSTDWQALLFVALSPQEGSDEASLVALDLETQETLWTLNNHDTNGAEIARLTQDTAILYTSGSNLIAIEKASGLVLWLSDLEGFLETPVKLDNGLYVRNIEIALYALDWKTGQEVGQLSVQANTPMKYDPERGPAVMGDLLLIPFGDHRVFVYKP